MKTILLKFSHDLLVHFFQIVQWNFWDEIRLSLFYRREISNVEFLLVSYGILFFSIANTFSILHKSEILK